MFNNFLIDTTNMDQEQIRNASYPDLRPILRHLCDVIFRGQIGAFFKSTIESRFTIKATI